MGSRMISIDTLEQERTDLDLHVDLCAQRYAELDRRLSIVEEKIDTVSHKIDNNKSDLMKAFIATAGTIVVSVIGLVGVILTRLP